MLPRHTIDQAQVQLSAARPIRLQNLHVGGDVAPHDHGYYEICLLETGCVRHQTASETRKLGAGDVVVLPPGPVHAFQNPQNLRVWNVYYLAEWFLWDLATLWTNEGLVPLFFAASLFRKPDSIAIATFSLDTEEKSAVGRELRDLERENACENPSQLFLRGAFSKILVTMARAWAREQPQLNDFDFSREVWLALEEIERAIKNGDLFRVHDFARGVGMSGDHFARRFRLATGLCPSEYFALRRVQHAGYLLLQTGESATQIAARLGFADSAHLSRCFSKIQGHSPREFRRLYGARR